MTFRQYALIIAQQVYGKGGFASLIGTVYAARQLVRTFATLGFYVRVLSDRATPPGISEDIWRTVPSITANEIARSLDDVGKLRAEHDAREGRCTLLDQLLVYMIGHGKETNGTFNMLFGNSTPDVTSSISCAASVDDVFVDNVDSEDSQRKTPLEQGDCVESTSEEKETSAYARFSLEQLQSLLPEPRPQRVLLIIDACYSGAAIGLNETDDRMLDASGTADNCPVEMGGRQMSFQVLTSALRHESAWHNETGTLMAQALTEVWCHHAGGEENEQEMWISVKALQQRIDSVLQVMVNNIKSKLQYNEQVVQHTSCGRIKYGQSMEDADRRWGEFVCFFV